MVRLVSQNHLAKADLLLVLRTTIVRTATRTGLFCVTHPQLEYLTHVFFTYTSLSGSLSLFCTNLVHPANPGLDEEWIQERYGDSLHKYDSYGRLLNAWDDVPSDYPKELLQLMQAR